MVTKQCTKNVSLYYLFINIIFHIDLLTFFLSGYCYVLSIMECRCFIYLKGLYLVVTMTMPFLSYGIFKT